jgi:hypothetical protein
MWGIGGKLRRKYGVEGDVREALYKVSNTCTHATGWGWGWGWGWGYVLGCVLSEQVDVQGDGAS